MANRLELTCWDDRSKAPAAPVDGISHVRVERRGEFLTDSILESHRINSPYLLEGKKDRTFFNLLKEDLGGLEEGPIDRRRLAEVLLRYDVGSLLHGVFLAKKELAGGRLRVARALSAFIEADGVRVAPSGGVKNDHVNPSGDTRAGFGNVPFARDEYVADRITLYANLDLAQLRGYGLDKAANRLLQILALYKLRVLADGDLRLRTACDLTPVNPSEIMADVPAAWALPSRTALEAALRPAIDACGRQMRETTVAFEDELKKGREESGEEADGGRSGRGSLMATLLLRFPGGRYHATPWGHHVNEGLVEWPPSPWRVLRALMAVGYTALGWTEMPLEARALFTTLATRLPRYTLPPAALAQSRH